MIPVQVVRVDGVEQWGGALGPGRRAECSKCGRCVVKPDDGHTPAKAAKRAITELARGCQEGVFRYYRNRLPAGVSLFWQFRDTWRPAHWFGNRVCGGSGEVDSQCPVRVVAANAKAVRHAVRVAERIRRHWQFVTVERPAEESPVAAEVTT
jgi:hypothetical protein